jgi:hypothetical protein
LCFDGACFVPNHRLGYNLRLGHKHGSIALIKLRHGSVMLQKTQRGRTPTEMSREHLKAPDLSAQQQANELIRLIRKLRWMGMEEEAEAERVHAELAQCGAQPADSVLAAPHETD